VAHVADHPVLGQGQHIAEGVPPVYRLEDRELAPVSAPLLGAGCVHIGHILADNVQPQVLGRDA
jgi:hypothetical protein